MARTRGTSWEDGEWAAPFQTPPASLVFIHILVHSSFPEDSSRRFPANLPTCSVSCFFSPQWLISFSRLLHSGIPLELGKRQANNRDWFWGRCWCCQKQLNVGLKQKWENKPGGISGVVWAVHAGTGMPFSVFSCTFLTTYTKWAPLGTCSWKGIKANNP